jgi:hypothetical protein
MDRRDGVGASAEAVELTYTRRRGRRFILRSSDGKGRLTLLPKRGLADGGGDGPSAEGEAARLHVLLDRHLRRV